MAVLEGDISQSLPEEFHTQSAALLSIVLKRQNPTTPNTTHTTQAYYPNEGQVKTFCGPSLASIWYLWVNRDRQDTQPNTMQPVQLGFLLARDVFQRYKVLLLLVSSFFSFFFLLLLLVHINTNLGCIKHPRICCFFADLKH